MENGREAWVGVGGVESDVQVVESELGRGVVGMSSDHLSRPTTKFAEFHKDSKLQKVFECDKC